MNTRYTSYISLLRKAGFKQASQKPEHFYKPATEKTAFILNIYLETNRIRIVFGFTSTAFFAFGAGDKIFFEQHGSSDDDCTLRYALEIKNDSDAIIAQNKIDSFYRQYCNIEKDELLAVVKARRKEFFQIITDLLKPLKFKKSGNKWTRIISEKFFLEFHAQKSAYSDQYYFNISIAPTDAKGSSVCYHTRIIENKSNIFDWQLLSAVSMQSLLSNAVQTLILPLLDAPLAELGQQPWLWKHCICKRVICQDCWVAHNRWELKEMENHR